jgi:tetratricopeptide (TPR) repeat protein
MMLGGVYQFLEGMDKRKVFLFQALDLANSLNDLSRQAVALSGLGWDQRDPRQARKYWDRSVALFRQIGDWRNLGFLLGVYADTLMANNEVEAAHPLLDEAMEIGQRLNNKQIVEFVLVAKSREALLNGDFAQSREALQEWLEIAEKMGNRMGYLWGRARLGHVLLVGGNVEEGSQILYETAREFHSDWNRIGLAFTLEKLCRLFTTSNLPERTARLIGWADQIREQTGDARPYLEQKDLDHDLESCASLVGRARVMAEMDLGAGMSLDEALALALHES